MQIVKLVKHSGLWWCEYQPEPILTTGCKTIMQAVHELNSKLAGLGGDVLPYPYEDSLLPR